MIETGKIAPEKLIGRCISLEEAIASLTTMDKSTATGLSIITQLG
jgi:alcohol dehydrogenase